MTSPAGAGTFAWEEARARLARTRRALTGTQSRQEARALLRHRAELLAAPLPTQTELVAGTLIVFAAGGERYGIEGHSVQEVVSAGTVTPVPCTPPFVLGVVSHRGRILAAVDLPRLLDTGAPPLEPRVLVVVEAGAEPFALASDGEVDLVALGLEELEPRADDGSERRAFARGVTRDLVTVLDVEALRREPGFEIDESVD